MPLTKLENDALSNTVTANVASLTIGANVSANATTVFVGNSTANVSHTATSLSVANSTNTATLTSTSLTIGATVVNTTSVTTTGQLSLSNQYRCAAYSTKTIGGTAQSINNNTWTAVALDAELYNFGTLHSNSTNNSRMTIPSDGAGVYLINGKVGWAANTVGDRLLAITKNATGSGFQRINCMNGQSLSVGILSQEVNLAVYLNGGDWVELDVYQSSGGSLQIGGDAGIYYTCDLHITRLY